MPSRSPKSNKVDCEAPNTPTGDLHNRALGLKHIAPSGSSGPTANAPSNISWGVGLSFGVGAVQTLLALDATGRAWIQGRMSDTWSDWAQIATATPPVPYALPTISGLESCGESSYFKTQENIVVVKFRLKPTLAQVSAGAVIATLPVGYKPVFYVESPIFVRLSNGTMTSGTVGVDVNGSVILYNCSAPVGSEIIGSVPPYIAAN